MLPERGGKEQQQQLSRKVSTGQAASKAQKRSVARATYVGRLASFSSFESLVLASVMRSKPPVCCLSAAAKSSGSSWGEWVRHNAVRSA